MRWILVVAVWSLAGLTHAAEVRLRASAACASPVVRLGQVAEIEAEPELAAALAEVPLCPAPAAGDQRELSQNDIRQILAQSGVERADIRVTGSESVQLLPGRAESPAVRRTAPIASGVRQAQFQSLQPKALPEARKTSVAPQAEAKAAVAPIRLVERGALVNVISRKPGVQVVSSGKALAAGAAGDTILIEMTEHKAHIPARVVAPDTVEALGLLGK